MIHEMAQTARSPAGSGRAADRLLGALLTGAGAQQAAGHAGERAIRDLASESLAGFVHHALGRVPDTAAADVARLRGRLRPLRWAQTARSLRRTARLADALDALDGIPVMPLKGTELAHRLYASPELRESCDIDLWVRPTDLDSALAALAAAGFDEENTDPAVRAFHRESGHHVPLTCRATGLCLEVHHRLYPDFPAAAHESIWRRAGPSRLLGRAVLAPDPCDRVLILAVHLLWTGLPGSGKWLLDTVLLARSRDDRLRPDPGALIERARQLDQAVSIVLLARAARVRWGVADLTPWETALLPDLRGPERRLLRRLDRRGPDLDASACIAARRLSGRAVARRRALWSSVWCHPGAVCLELGVRSDAPLFLLHRLRHASLRLRRALRGLGFRPLPRSGAVAQASL